MRRSAEARLKIGKFTDFFVIYSRVEHHLFNSMIILTKNFAGIDEKIV